MTSAAMSVSDFPQLLRTRRGWRQWLEAQLTAEPHLHQLEPTNHCPYACVMCPRARHMRRARGYLDWVLFEKVITEVAGYSAAVREKEIELFHFGESLLHPRIAEMVAAVGELGLRCCLSVNAPELEPELAERILAGRPHRLIISLDGHDAASYREIRGPAADYERAVANLRWLGERLRREPRPYRVVLRIIRLHRNAPYLEQFRRQWQDAGFAVEVRPFFPWSDAAMANLGEVRRYPPGMPCPFPWQYLVVQWDGTVVPCCRDYDGANALGNIRDATLKEIWQGVALDRVRRQLAEGEYGDNELCRRCMAIFQTSEEAEPPETIGALWADAVTRHADRGLLLDEASGERMSYAEADAVVGRIAARLAAAGLRRGERIAVCSPQHAEAALLFWAAMRLGLVYVPLDPQLPGGALSGILARLAPRLVFLGTTTACPPEVDQAQAVHFDAPDGTARSGRSFADWLETMPDPGPATPALIEETAVAPDDPAVILFTSGTAGPPKGVVLSHAALHRSGALMAETYRWRADDLLFSPGDFHTMSGLRNPLVASLHAGAGLLLAGPQPRSSALGVAAAIVQHGVSLLATVPALLRQFLLLQERGSVGLGRLRAVLCTGSTLTPSVAAAFTAAYHVPVWNYYGLTETAGLCAGVTPGAAAPPDSFGLPLGCRMRIIDDNGRDLPPAQAGELLVASDRLMTGYFDDPAATAAVLRDGWFATGDLVRRDAQGFLFLLGRRSDAIKDARGELVHPEAVERVLEEHPMVAEAGVCGIRDADGTERLHAGIVQRAGGIPELWRELRELVLTRLGPTRLPAQFRQLPELPRGVNAKLNRRRLAEILDQPPTGVACS